MDTVTVTICWKLAAQPKSQTKVTVNRGTTLGELLNQLEQQIDVQETLVVYNGRTALVTDEINQDGQIVILPLLCGG